MDLDHSFTSVELLRRKSSLKDQLNSSLRSVQSPLKTQTNKTIKTLFASFGLTPPPSICKSGSSDALWFSSKFEKKMANVDDIPSSPLSRFQREVPLRQSKQTNGPFRATQIWNEVIEHLKEKVELKKRRYKLKNYEDSFTGTDAVDVVLHYLLRDNGTFCNLSREKAVKLCQALMEKKVFRPVGEKAGESTSKYQFEDSSGKVYQFFGIHSNKENEPPIHSDSDSETEGRDDFCDTAMEEGTEDTPPEHIRINTEDDSDLDEASICNPPVIHSGKKGLPSLAVRKHSKRKNLDSSQRSTKRMRMYASSTESLNENTLTEEQIQDIWKEVALCQLLTIVDLSFLDGVLGEDKEKTSKKFTKSFHNTSVTPNIVAKHWSLTCAASSVSHKDAFMRTALECIAHIPRGISKFDTDFTRSSDAVTKLQAYNMICEHYSQKLDSLFPDRFLDLNLAIMKHVLAEREEAALDAMQLNMILLAERQKEELRRLLKFMATAATDKDLQLSREMSNENVVLNDFTDNVLKHKGLAWNLAVVLTTFLMRNVEQIFTVPVNFREKVETKIKEVKNGEVSVVKDTIFCNQISTTEYNKQTDECTSRSLIMMMNLIIDNPKIALKEKKQRLRQFRKYHPHIYSKNFVGMVE